MYEFNPQFDLKLERMVDLPIEKIWQAWTDPKLLPIWFCPRPWGVKECQIDLQPGGIFSTVMLSPEGEEFPNSGCYLVVEPPFRLVWTDALAPGFRPVEKPLSGAGMLFTARIELEARGSQTFYRAVAMHSTMEDRQRHEEMGFEQGWSICLEQLIECMRQNP